jgi:hypothetical protein
MNSGLKFCCIATLCLVWLSGCIYKDKYPMTMSDSTAVAVAIEKSSDRQLTIATIKENVNYDTINALSPALLGSADTAAALADKITSQLTPVTINKRKYWIIEGDLLMDYDDIYFYCLKRIQSKRDTAKIRNGAALTIGTVGTTLTQLEKWPENFIITYSVTRNSFNDDSNYYKVVRRMQAATTDWMKSCNVTFKYLPEFDEMDPSAKQPPSLIFTVREYNIQGKFVAVSFYPLDPANRRKLYIDPTYYSSSYDSVGALRHELGHILGFKHEAIWSKDPACAGESIILAGIGSQQLTTYDPNSVMHYVCGNEGSYKLEITRKDKSGAIEIYGPSQLK